MSTVTCIVSKLLQVMYCKYCNVYCKLSDCKKKKKRKFETRAGGSFLIYLKKIIPEKNSQCKITVGIEKWKACRF